MNYAQATASRILSAPTPRTADGKLNVSGVWDAADNIRCPPEGCNIFGQQFLRISWAGPSRQPRPDA
jgi:hypothetical protein